MGNKQTRQDELGDRMKMYEGLEDRQLMPLVPVLARVDGRCFHSFTRGMDRPFDDRLCAAMTYTARKLLEETGARTAYHQSDEITLVWHSTDLRSKIWFDGRLNKMVSGLAAQATLHFNDVVRTIMPEYESRNPTFDARVWTVPNRTEAANVFLWREWDATKNSISMAAQTLYSPKALHNKNTHEMQAMMLAKNVNWNDYPVRFRRGVYVQRKLFERQFTDAELAELPAGHAAITNPGLLIKRHRTQVVDMPPLASVVNREKVLFDKEDPVTR